jgi:hypothetical protein
MKLLPGLPSLLLSPLPSLPSPPPPHHGRERRLQSSRNEAIGRSSTSCRKRSGRLAAVPTLRVLMRALSNCVAAATPTKIRTIAALLASSPTWRTIRRRSPHRSAYDTLVASVCRALEKHESRRRGLRPMAARMAGPSRTGARVGVWRSGHRSCSARGPGPWGSP